MSMRTFAGAYGSEVGVAALKWIPRGGLYVTGGLTPKNMKWIQGEQNHFMRAFKDKGRVSGLLEEIPMYAVIAEDLGLRGAAVLAAKVLRQEFKCQEDGESRGLVDVLMSDWSTLATAAVSASCGIIAAITATAILGRRKA